MNRVEFVSYDGEYPCLCFGALVLRVDGVEWRFANSSLSSGGRVWFDSNWDEHVEEGPWCVTYWPNGFPEDAKREALQVINDNVPYGCCGGCV